MNEPVEPAGEPGREPLDRRWLLRASGLLAAGAGAVAAGAAGTAAEAAGAEPATDAPGAFGRPPTASTARGITKDTIIRGSTSQVHPGFVKGAETSSAAGAKLKPSAKAIDTTPLTRRTTGGETWKVEG